MAIYSSYPAGLSYPHGNGYWTCYICGLRERMTTEEFIGHMQAGHGYKRRKIRIK